MSDPKDLAEYTDNQLITEIKRRNRCKERGQCPYCYDLLGSKRICDHPDQHKSSIILTEQDRIYIRGTWITRSEIEGTGWESGRL